MFLAHDKTKSYLEYDLDLDLEYDLESRENGLDILPLPLWLGAPLPLIKPPL